MSEMVRAAVLEAPGKMSIQAFPMPHPGKGAAVCKMLKSAICGTDKHLYRGESKQYVGTAAETDADYPVIQGHENVMEIVEIDEEGARNLEFDGEYLKVGDKVTMCPDIVCGKCYYCKHMSWYPWCDNYGFNYGNTRGCKNAPHLYGGFAEYIYIEPGTKLYKIPEGLPDDIAVLTEMMCVTYTLDKAKEFYAFSGEGFGFNDPVFIQGCGPLGLGHVIKARMMGAGKIIVTDISDYKLELAKAFGADVVINSNRTTEDERVEIVKQETHGLGAAVAVECVGYPTVVSEGLRSLRKAGIYIECGAFVDTGAAPINMHEVCAKNLRIIGMCNHAHTGYRPTMEMMLRNKDNFPWERFISHHFKLEDAEKALLTSMTDESMKVVIEPWAR